MAILSHTQYESLHDPGLVGRFADLTLALDRESGWTLTRRAA